MFGKKKQLKEIENKLHEIEKKKEELLKIKEMLDDKSPKVDINNVYVLEIEEKQEYFIVKKYDRNFKEIKPLKCFDIIDILANRTLYKSIIVSGLKRTCLQNEDGEYNYINFKPICEVDKSLLVYTDKNVPLYRLQQLYYKLNNVDLSKVKTK